MKKFLTMLIVLLSLAAATSSLAACVDVGGTTDLEGEYGLCAMLFGEDDMIVIGEEENTPFDPIPDFMEYSITFDKNGNATIIIIAPSSKLQGSEIWTVTKETISATYEVKSEVITFREDGALLSYLETTLVNDEVRVTYNIGNTAVYHAMFAQY